MYARLVIRNAKRSVKQYLIYLVTMTICVTLFYSFFSIVLCVKLQQDDQLSTIVCYKVYNYTKKMSTYFLL